MDIIFYMRIGWITSSYGRLVHFLFNVETVFSIEKCKNPYERARAIAFAKRSLWVFPEAEEFPFIYSALSRRLIIKKSKFFLFLYKLACKLKLEKDYIVSTDDFRIFDRYENISESEDFTDLKHLISSKVDSLRIAGQFLLPDSFLDQGVVMVCVRDGIWSRDQGHSHTDILVNRNSDVNTFIPVIESLCTLGYRVARGGRSKILVRFEHDNFYDYAVSSEASDLYDAHLWMVARFAISTGFGADEWACIFNTPVLYVDFGEHVNRDLRGDLDRKRCYLPKVVVWKNNGKKLSMKELRDIGYFDYNVATNQNVLEHLGIILRPNELKLKQEVVLEFSQWLVNSDQNQFIEVEGRLISRYWENLNG